MKITAYDKRHKMTGRASRQCWKDKKLSSKAEQGKGTENETPLKPRADETGRVISSPVPTKAHARHVTKGKAQTSAMKSIEAEAVTIGLPYLKARETVQIENIGKKFSGSWRIIKVRHEISNGGYTCTMTLSKNDHECKNQRRSGHRSQRK